MQYSCVEIYILGAQNYFYATEGMRELLQDSPESEEAIAYIHAELCERIFSLGEFLYHCSISIPLLDFLCRNRPDDYCQDMN